MRSNVPTGFHSSDESTPAANPGRLAGSSASATRRFPTLSWAALAAVMALVAVAAWCSTRTPADHAGRVLAHSQATFPALAAAWSTRADVRPTTETLSGAAVTGWKQHASPNSQFSSFFASDFAAGGLVRAAGCVIEHRPLGAAASTGHVVDGKLVYADAFTATDVLYTLGSHDSEEFLVLRDASAPTRFTTRLQAPHDAPALIAVSPTSGGLTVTAADGSLANIGAPYVVDANGRRSSAATWVVAARESGVWEVSLALDPAGLAYPLVIDPSWSAGAALATARYEHTATLLANGKVLVVGGLGSSSVLGSCELYDPAAGTWSATGSLIHPRSAHTATLLSDGTVLVTGGDSGSVTATCELYNPATGTWSGTNSMSTARTVHTATLLDDGRVLVVGGDASSSLTSSLTSCEIYDPVAKTWSPTAALTAARNSHTATKLPSGLVLVAGGFDSTNGGDLNSCEIFDPAINGSWSTTGSLNTPRSFHTATLLDSGLVLVTGGYSGNGSCELFDAGKGTWIATGSLNDQPLSHTATLLPNGKVITLGGSTASDVRLSDTQRFNAQTGTWTALTTLPLTTARRSHTATLLDNGLILVVGGSNTGTAPLASTELFDPSIHLSISGLTAIDRVYDGTTAIALSATSAALVGVLTEDASGVSLDTSSVSAAVATASAGSAKPVTVSGLALTGAASQGYVLDAPSLTVTISAAPQTITFTTIPTQDFGGTAFQLQLSASSDANLPISFAVLSGPATVTGSNLTITGAGTVVVEASQAGDGNHSAATSVSQSVTVNDAVPPPLAMTGAVTAVYGQSVTLRASGGQGTYTVSATGGTATIGQLATDQTGAYYPVVVTAAAAGPVRVTLHDGAAGVAIHTVTFTPASQTITFPLVGDTFFGGVARTISLSATSDAGLPVTFQVVSGPGSVSGTTLSITGPGTIVVAAQQAGNANYLAATSVSQSIMVTDTTPPAPSLSGTTSGLVGQALTLQIADGFGSFTVSATAAVTILGQTSVPAQTTALTAKGAITTTPLTVIPTAPGTLVVSVRDELNRVGTWSLDITELAVADQPKPIITVSTSTQTLFGSICPGSTRGVAALRAAFAQREDTVRRGFTWDAPSQSYRELPDEPSAGLTSTDGVFLASRVQVDLDFSGPAMPPGATLVLYPGWNFVGLGPVRLTSGEVVNDHDLMAEFDYTDLDGATANQIDVSAAYLWDGTSYSAATLIAAGKGYFIKNVSSPAKTILLSRRDIGPSPRTVASAQSRGLARDVGAPPAVPAAAVDSADSGSSGSCGGGSGSAVMLTGLAVCLGWFLRRPRR
jgi:hypothetical protein